jgi:hypothetical protein
MPRMNSIGRIVVAVTVALGLGACRVQEPVAPSLEVPRDGAQVCANHCATMGLALGSVVLVSNKMGCVCVPPPAPASPPPVVVGGAGAVSALAFIADEEAAAQQQQQQSQQRRANQH